MLSVETTKPLSMEAVRVRKEVTIEAPKMAVYARRLQFQKNLISQVKNGKLRHKPIGADRFLRRKLSRRRSEVQSSEKEDESIREKGKLLMRSILQAATGSEEALTPLQVWKKWVRLVRMMCSVCRTLKEYSKSGYIDWDKLRRSQPVRLRLKRKDGTIVEGEDAYFNFDDYKRKKEVTWPKHALKCIEKPPDERTQADITVIKSLLINLPSFRKYTNVMQDLLCKVVRFCFYNKQRCIVRKGHPGTSFYFIFSGSVSVVFDTDSDSTFVRPEVSVLKRGEVFGEIALMKDTTRNASIVCFEDTELLAVDKEEFHKFGLYDIMQKELKYRRDFLTQLDLFSSWDRDDIEDLCFYSRVEEFSNNKVIVEDARNSDWLYFISKGGCDVLRKINLCESPDFEALIPKHQQPNEYNGIPPVLLDVDTSLDYIKKHAESSRRQLLRRRTTVRDKDLLDANSLKMFYETQLDDHHKPLLNHEQLKKHFQLNLKKHLRPATSLGHISESNSRIDLTEEPEQRGRSVSFSAPVERRCKSANTLRSADVIEEDENENDEQESESRSSDYEGSEEYDPEMDYGISVYVRLDHMVPGTCFGVENVFEEIKSKRVCLVSRGCIVIRVPRSKFMNCMDQKTTTKCTLMCPDYPDDRELCLKFLKQNSWRIFKDDLVNLVVRDLNKKEAIECFDTTKTNIPDYRRRQQLTFARPSIPIKPIVYKGYENIPEHHLKKQSRSEEQDLISAAPLSLSRPESRSSTAAVKRTREFTPSKLPHMIASKSSSSSLLQR